MVLHSRGSCQCRSQQESSDLDLEQSREIDPKTGHCAECAQRELIDVLEDAVVPFDTDETVHQHDLLCDICDLIEFTDAVELRNLIKQAKRNREFERVVARTHIAAPKID